jgi:hypothetical protein
VERITRSTKAESSIKSGRSSGTQSNAEDHLNVRGGSYLRSTTEGMDGLMRHLRPQRRTVSVIPTSIEKILEAEAGCRLVYTVIGGIPVRNYRAEVTLTRSGDENLTGRRKPSALSRSSCCSVWFWPG